MKMICKRLASAKVDGGLDFILSNATPDRLGDIIDPKGWDLTAFKQNPIALFNHRSAEPPIGRWANVRIEGNALRGTLEFAEAGTSARIDELRSLTEQGILRAASVGFKPLEYETFKNGDDTGIHFKRQELLETSLVSIPANSDALAIAKSLNLSADVRALIFGKHADEDQSARLQFIGKQAAIPLLARTTMTLQQRIEDAQKRLVVLKDQLAEHHATYDENVTDDKYVAMTEELNGKIATLQRNLDSFEESERQLAATSVATTSSKGSGGAGETVLRRPFAQAAPAEKVRDGEYFMRTLIATVVARARGWRPGLDSPEPFFRALTERYGEDGKVDAKTKMVAEIVLRSENEYPIEAFNRAFNGGVQRAASAPAMTTPAGTGPNWAGALVATGYQDFLQLLLPASVFPGLAARAMRMTFGRNGVISIPTRVSTPTIGGSFVAEGGAIPVRQGAFSAQTFLPKKMGVISAFTREIAEHSTPAIEQLIRMAMQEDTSVNLDSVLLDSTAATVIRPAGIRAGVSKTTATAGGGFAALVGDIKALTGALMTGSGGNIRSPVWLMNPQQGLSIQLTQNAGGDFPFAAEINASRFTGYPLILSGNVPSGVVILLDAADFAVIEGGAPRFDVSDQAVLHFEDTTPLQISTGAQGSGVLATPTRSLWQTDSMAIRMVLDVNWGFVRTGTVAWTDTVTW